MGLGDLRYVRPSAPLGDSSLCDPVGTEGVEQQTAPGTPLPLRMQRLFDPDAGMDQLDHRDGDVAGEQPMNRLCRPLWLLKPLLVSPFAFRALWGSELIREISSI